MLQLLVGMLKDRNEEAAWIGAQMKGVKSVNLYGQELDYINWGTYNGRQEPSGHTLADCIVLYREAGMGIWHCHNISFAYICEI